VEQGLRNSQASVHPSVNPIDRQQQWPPAAGLLLSTLRVEDIDQYQALALVSNCAGSRRKAANVGRQCHLDS